MLFHKNNLAEIMGRIAEKAAILRQNLKIAPGNNNEHHGKKGIASPENDTSEKDQLFEKTGREV